jgi:hypothetical protein
MLPRSLIVLCAVLLALPSAASNGRMALLPLSAGSGSSQEDVLRLEGALRASIESVAGRNLESPASTRELIESAANLGVDCQPSDLDCLLKLAVLVEIDVLLVPSVSLSQDAFKLNLANIDAREKAVTRTVQHVISSRSETFGKDVEAVAVDLLAPDKHVGSLQVTASHDGATISIDDSARGTTPVSQIDGLSVGTHLVVVSLPGAAPIAKNVEIKYGQVAALDATFENVDPNAVATNGGGTATGGGSSTGDLLFVTGAALTGIGGGIALLAGTGAAVSEIFLYTEEGSFETREAVKNTGVVLLVMAAGSAVVGA